jgi:hypothetical protein
MEPLSQNFVEVRPDEFGCIVSPLRAIDARIGSRD